jgi:hypothetical protein
MAITKKTNSENSSFWESTRDARVKVENWPSWKRNLRVTQYSVGFDSQSSEASTSDSTPACTKDE